MSLYQSPDEGSHTRYWYSKKSSDVSVTIFFFAYAPATVLFLLKFVEQIYYKLNSQVNWGT